ncbi:40904_t:CDS:1, partial [Gigaspora margarita]
QGEAGVEFSKFSRVGLKRLLLAPGKNAMQIFRNYRAYDKD